MILGYKLSKPRKTEQKENTKCTTSNFSPCSFFFLWRQALKVRSLLLARRSELESSWVEELLLNTEGHIVRALQDHKVTKGEHKQDCDMVDHFTSQVSGRDLSSRLGDRERITYRTLH